MVVPIIYPVVARFRSRIQQTNFSRDNLSWNRARIVAFCICFVLFSRALSGSGNVKGHAQVHCPLLVNNHRYLPIALVHEAKIAELHRKMWEGGRTADMAVSPRRKRRVEEDSNSDADTEGEVTDQIIDAKDEADSSPIIDTSTPSSDSVAPVVSDIVEPDVDDTNVEPSEFSGEEVAKDGDPTDDANFASPPSRDVADAEFGVQPESQPHEGQDIPEGGYEAYNI